MSTTTTQYMSLVLPVPTTERGPDYAVEINSAMTLIDQHDHSGGKGTPITPTGLDINADLEFNGNDATELRSSRYEVQASPLATASDLGCAYVSGVDLYYNDVNGNQIRLTQSGSVAGTPGSISGLVAPASVSYNPGSQTFTFQSTTATAANIDAGSYTVRETVANGKGVTLTAAAGLTNNYTLTLPTAVATATSFVTSDSSGNLSYTAPDNISLQISSSGLSIKSQGVTNAKLAPVNTVIRALATFSSSTAALTEVSNSSLTIFTSGRPIQISLQGSTGAVGAIVNANGGGASSITGLIGVSSDNGATFVAQEIFGGAESAATITQVRLNPSAFQVVDYTKVASSSYTYKLYLGSNNAANLISITNTNFILREL